MPAGMSRNCVPLRRNGEIIHCRFDGRKWEIKNKTVPFGAAEGNGTAARGDARPPVYMKTTGLGISQFHP